MDPLLPPPPGSPDPLPRPSDSFPRLLLPPLPSSPPHSPPFLAPPSLPNPSTNPTFYPDSLQFSTIYNLMLSRQFSSMQNLPFPSFLPPSPHPSLPFLRPPNLTFGPPADLALFPMAKLDPRLFRVPFPEEPKPQHSYIGLISMAILSNPEKKLVLADIYQYILDNYLYFRHRGPGWRNSIRHNLSLNDCFIKAGRAANGKGHYWAVHPACVADFQKGDFRRRRAQRKVRRHMGLHQEQDEEDEDSPPPSPASLPPVLPLPGADAPESPDLSPVKQKPFSFGVDFLLAKPEREEDRKPDIYINQF